MQQVSEMRSFVKKTEGYLATSNIRISYHIALYRPRRSNEIEM